MSVWKLILSCTLLSLCSADPTFTVTNSMLDPNRIFWWRTKWASAPILLSVNNLNQVSTVTFFFSPTTSLTNGVFEVTFPTGFTVGAGGTGQTYAGQVVQYTPVTYLGGQDYQVTVSGIRNPNLTGAYGPFALRTRYSANSQQVDVNLAFGSVWVYSAAGILGSFTVSMAGTTINNVINKNGNSLSYTFTLGVNLWRYDTFILGVDSRWTVASGATCASVNTPGRWNNFNGTNSANPHLLDCIVTTGFVYIYGLAVDGIDLAATADNAYVNLIVSSVTTPNAVYAANPYIWTASTSRFGTTTILETATYSGGPEVTTDVINSATWVPTWGLLTSAIASGTTYFMDLSFTITNAIPANGKITIQVTENISAIDARWVAGAASNCYIVTYLSTGSLITSYAPTCTIVTNLITLTGFPALSGGTTIKLRNVVTFTLGSGITEKITSISTFDPSGNPIDVGANLAAFTLATNSQIAYLGVFFVATAATTTTTVNQAGNTAATQAISFSISIPAPPAFIASTTGTIYCPFTSDIEDFSINIPPSSASFAYTLAAPAVGGGVVTTPGAVPQTFATVISSNVPLLTTTGLYTTQGTLSFAGNISQPSGSATVTFTTALNILAYVASGTSYFSLPRVANNLATAYECRLTLVTNSMVNTVATVSAGYRFVIAPQIWSTITYSSPCSYYIDGIPGIFTLQPKILPAPPSSNIGAIYYVEFSFPTVIGNFGTNSGIGPTPKVTTQNAQSSLNSLFTTPYPVSSSQSAPVSGVTYVVGTTNYVAVTGVSVAGFIALPASTVMVTFPIGGYLSTSSVTPTVTTFYILTSDPRYKFITHTSTAPAFTYTAITASITAGIIGTTGTNVNGQTITTGFSLGLYGVPAGSPVNFQLSYYIYVLLGKGITWATKKSIASAGSSFTGAYYFSLNSSFGYTGALLYVAYVSGLPVINGFSTAATGTTSTITLSGFTLPLGVAVTNVSIGIGGWAGGATKCTALVTGATIQYSSTVGAITSLAITPNSIKTAGPEGVNVSHAVTFSLQHGIPEGGSINMAFSSTWTIPTLSTACTYCSVIGVSGITTGTTTTAPVCTIGVNTVSVTGFAGFSSTSSAVINIVLYGLISPSAVTSSSGTQFVTGLTTNVGNIATTAIIDQATVFTNTTVTVAVSASPGPTTWFKKRTYPSTAGAVGVGLYLRFSLPHSLPTCGIITLSSPMPFLYLSGSVNNWSFLSPIQYSSSVMSFNGLQIKLGQPYTGGSVLELYLDNAVNNPSTSDTTTSGFQIISSWGGVTVDQDTGTITSKQAFTPTAAPTGNITNTNSTALSFTPMTTGEVATYAIDFQDSVSYAVGDQYWIVFPSQFDYFLGRNTVWFTNEPNSYYVDCSCTQLGSIWCTVNHNILVVSGNTAITGNTEIAIVIYNVVNPAPASTGPFQIYHVDSNGVYLSINQNYGTVTPWIFPSNLYVRSLIQTDNRLFQPSKYTWRLYILDIMNNDSHLQVLFPREFDLSKFDKKSSYACSSNWLDISANAPTKTTQNWNSASTCIASGNLVSLPAPKTAITFISTNIVTLNIQGVTNTQWGVPRYARSAITDFDVQDYTIWPIYQYWVNKFTFFVYRSNYLLYTSRSYPNTNAAYAGFIDGYRPLYVNNYSPQSKTNRIVVYAGTQTTDIYISTASATQPCSALQIVFTPITNTRTPDNGMLKYTSATNNWILVESYWQIQFRVAADIGLAKGLYYIDWSNSETKQSGLTDVQYATPASTLVEVIAATEVFYKFTVAAIPTIFTGYTSIPILVSIANAPHSDVSVNLSVIGSPTSISVIPMLLTFGPDINALYFQVTVASNYDTYQGTEQSLGFSVTGTDSSVYSIIDSITFSISQPSSTVVAGNVINWGLGIPTKTIETIAPAADQIGVIYYELAAAGTAIPSFSTLKASVGSPVNANSTSSTVISSAQTPTSQSEPLAGETWVQFQYRLYKTHLQTVWVGSIVMTTTTATTTIAFNWLYAATEYQLSGYLDNLSPSTIPLVHTENFTTTDIADPQPFSISFNGNVGFSFEGKIAQEAANAQGVNPLRLGTATYNQNTSRILTTASVTSTVFTYTLVPNRYSESPDPSTQAQISGTAYTTFANNLVNDGITSTLTSVTNTAVPSRTVPVWITVPTSAGSTTDSISVSLRSNIAGSTCCVALKSSNIQPTPEQVMLGLDTSNNSTSFTCISTDLTQTNNTVQISKLQAGTSYYAFCTAMDDYPLWPTQMIYSDISPMSSVAIVTVTANITTTTTSGSYIGGLLLLLALLIH